MCHDSYAGSLGGRVAASPTSSLRQTVASSETGPQKALPISIHRHHYPALNRQYRPQVEKGRYLTARFGTCDSEQAAASTGVAPSDSRTRDQAAQHHLTGCHENDCDQAARGGPAVARPLSRPLPHLPAQH